MLAQSLSAANGKGAALLDQARAKRSWLDSWVAMWRSLPDARATVGQTPTRQAVVVAFQAGVKAADFPAWAGFGHGYLMAGAGEGR